MISRTTVFRLLYYISDSWSYLDFSGLLYLGLVELFNTFLCPLMPPSPMMHGALGGCGVAPHAGRCVFVDPQLPHSIVRKQHGRNDCLPTCCFLFHSNLFCYLYNKPLIVFLTGKPLIVIASTSILYPLRFPGAYLVIASTIILYPL